jgi:hypothetical protein
MILDSQNFTGFLSYTIGIVASETKDIREFQSSAMTISVHGLVGTDNGVACELYAGNAETTSVLV